MLRVAMVALSATLAVGALAPKDAAAQASGRERAEAARRGGVIIDGRRDSRVDDRCYDDRYDRRYDRRSNRRDERYRNRDDRDSDRKNDRYRRSDRRDRYDNCDDVYSRTSRGKNGGPKFCQNGQGHPVHGMAWCREKGWDRGYSLRNTGWSDVYLRRTRDVARRDLGRSILQDILGRSVYGRFDNQRERLGLNGPLTGYWNDTSNGSLLNLFANGLQIAQIIDRNRDGRADVVLLAYDR